MKTYLVIPEFDISPDDFFIVEASTPEEAQKYMSKNLYKNDELFIEYLKDWSINLSFAERFWIKTKEEHEYFNEKCAILIDFNEFQVRVKKYFGEYAKAAEDYITYYSLIRNGEEEKAAEAFEHFINNAEEFLFLEYLEYTSYQVLDIHDIKRL